MPPFDPNRNPHPRGRILDHLSWATSGAVHPIQRKGNLTYYAARNPRGYQHDLGAQDAFWDHFGILVADQFDSKLVYERYVRSVRDLMREWDDTQICALQSEPWWGNHYNSHSRQADAGEPRSRLRFMADERLRFMCEGSSDGSTNQIEENSDSIWDDGAYLPQGWNVTDWPVDPEPVPPVNTGGLILPPDWKAPTWPPRILHPRESTPDLPLRVEADIESLRPYRAICRDQGYSPSCAAHAVCAALDISLWRKGMVSRPQRIFSPAWLHSRTGPDPMAGRALHSLLDVVSIELPCEESAFPLSLVETETWNTPNRISSSKELTRRYAPPIMQGIKTNEIAMMKQFLAAGWVIVLGTAIHKDFLSSALFRYGLPACPIPDGTVAPEGHAWLLVGYDHCDGQAQWKYQGRFIALNSWGLGYPSLPVHEAGFLSLPFSFVLEYGFDACAFRY